MMSDAAIIILNCDSRKFSGNFLIDDEVLVSSGVKDLKIYNCVKDINDFDLIPDFFV